MPAHFYLYLFFFLLAGWAKMTSRCASLFYMTMHHEPSTNHIVIARKFLCPDVNIMSSSRQKHKTPHTQYIIIDHQTLNIIKISKGLFFFQRRRNIIWSYNVIIHHHIVICKNFVQFRVHLVTHMCMNKLTIMFRSKIMIKNH